MTDREAMKLALEALEGIHVGNMTPMAEENWNKAITALRQALEQPAQQQEPVVKWQPIETVPMCEEVIVWSEFDGVCAGILNSYGEWYSPFSEYKLTRVRMWMPLPDAPIEAALKEKNRE